MKDGFAHFDRRLERLDERKAALEAGHRTELDESGLIKLIPTGERRRQINRMIPLRAAMIIAGVLLTLKGFLLYKLGFGVYTSKVASMARGDTMDQIGAWIMQVEPVTLAVYNFIAFVAG
jgi:hypothetical protein